METFKTMTCRKSVRSYKSTLSDANLQKILMAAQAAPCLLYTSDAADDQ